MMDFKHILKSRGGALFLDSQTYKVVALDDPPLWNRTGPSRDNNPTHYLLASRNISYRLIERSRDVSK